MSPFISLSSRDRLMVIAPHPDDESLATGGLLQRAVRSGAQVRVVFASDGDNNPWPQRVLERRWRIGPSDRRRWGNRRRQEALRALEQLGLDKDCAHFLDFRDQGCTQALLEDGIASAEKFQRQIEAWRPTLLVSPSHHDVHPDHNALSVIIAMAVENVRPDMRPESLHFVVHSRPERRLTRTINLHLRGEELETKREAILCHNTQMVLSRERFTAYARTVEPYFPSDTEDVDHPIREIIQDRGALCIRLAPKRVPFLRGELWVAGGSLDEPGLRWRIPLRPHSARVHIQDGNPKAARRSATIRNFRDELEVRLPLGPLSAATRLFVKLNRRLAFYDEAGWREIPLQISTPVLCSDQPPSEALLSSCSFAASFFGGDSESSV